GDEIGMMGAHDPDCRRPMNWKYTEDKEKVALHDWYKKLIQIRKDFSCLRTGDFHTVLTDGMVYAYKRSNDNCSITVVINNDTQAHTVKIPFKEGQKSAINLINDISYQITDGEMEITLQPMSGAILK
ncbi:alpha-glucosidase C-terminal domain-containing protein, partial [bacterium]|nr:alpha-glucosidase C-terminal domain-containing protein [bacterium]